MSEGETESRLSSRKFWLALIFGLCAQVLMYEKIISSSDWMIVTSVCIGGYQAANAIIKVKNGG